MGFHYNKDKDQGRGVLAKIHHVSSQRRDIQDAVTALDEHPVAVVGSVRGAFGSKRAPAPNRNNDPEFDPA